MFLYRVRQPDGFRLFDTPEEAKKHGGEADFAIHAVEPNALKLPAGYWTEAEARERWRPLADAIHRRYSRGSDLRLFIACQNYPAIIAAPTRNYRPRDGIYERRGCDHQPTDLFRWRESREKGLVFHVDIYRDSDLGDLGYAAGHERVWLGNDTHPPAALD